MFQLILSESFTLIYFIKRNIYYLIIFNIIESSSTYFFWNITILSSSRSLTLMPLPFSMTMGCLRHTSQPTWEKKNPLLALWGSASVSLYLWWTRWSRTHSYTWFCGRDMYYEYNMMKAHFSWQVESVTYDVSPSFNNTNIFT